MGVRSGQDTVAVRLGIGHVGSAYPSPIKATQPKSGLFPSALVGIKPTRQEVTTK